MNPDSEGRGPAGTEDPRLLTRTGEPRYRELGLARATADDLIEAMTRHPELIQRPVVIWPDRAVIARPPNSSCRSCKPAVSLAARIAA